MAVTETTTESWGSRLGGSIKGVAIGGALFIAGIPLLFWNEGRAVKTAKALEEGASVCVKLPNADTVDATMDGKLVHVTGTAKTDDQLGDDLFPGLNPKAIRLTRKVEFYQWVENEKKEKKKNVGGSETTVTTYTYSKKWVSKPVDSSSFREAGHDNQVFFPEASDRTLVAETARYGAFELTADQIKRIGGAKPVELKPEYIPESLQGRVTISGNYAAVETGTGVTVMSASDWAEKYPEIYASYMANSENKDVIDHVEEYPMIGVVYEGMAFNKFYGSARGHYYTVQDVTSTGRPHALANCFTCKTPDFTAKVNNEGVSAYTIPFADMLAQVNESVSCYNCHANTPGELVVTHTYLADAMGDDFAALNPETASCAQCHVEYYFAPETKAVTLPYSSLETMNPDSILAFAASASAAQVMATRSPSML